MPHTQNPDTLSRRITSAIHPVPPSLGAPPTTATVRVGRLCTDDGPVAIDVPRDRDGTFEPQLIGKTRAALHRLRRQGHPLCGRGL